MGISIPPLVTPQGPNPNQPIGQEAVQAFLQAFLESQRQKGATSRTSMQEAAAGDRARMQHEADMGNVALRQKEYDLKIAEHKSEQARLKALGAALKQVLASGGAMSQGQSAQEPQVGLTPSSEQGPQWTDQAQAQPTDMAGVLQQIPPEVLSSVLDQMSKVATIHQQQQRDAITKQYPASPNETPALMIDRLGRMSGAFASAGDHSMVASLAEDIGALKPPKAEYEWFMTKDGKSTVYLPKEEGSKQRLGKPITQGGFGFGPGGPLSIMRGISAVAGMQQAHEVMKPYELKVASGQATTTDKDWFQGQISQLYNEQAKQSGVAGYLVPFFGTAVGTQMLERLNKENPEYANYLQAASQWALEDALLSNRPSDFRTRMDEFVSAVKPGAGIQSIHNLWKSRGVRLAGYQRGIPALKALLDRVTVMPGTTIVPEMPPQP